MSSIRVLLACVPALGERVPREIADMPGPDDVVPFLLSLAGAPASR